MPSEPDAGRPEEAATRLRRLLAETAVRPSLDRCCSFFPDFFDQFYATLADNAPGVGAMFANVDMSKQNALVRDGIQRLVDFAAGDTAAEAELHRLGELHDRSHLSVDPALYPIWVDSLVLAVREYDGAYTTSLEEAWREVLRPGLAIMIARFADSTPPPKPG
jgi:hypothetical protein